MTTIFLRDGLIFDGTGAAPCVASILVRDGRIAEFGEMEPPPGVPVFNASGLAVSPGFIDLHSHSDLKTLDCDQAKALQGVTTEVVGNCGFSAFPTGGHAGIVGSYNEGILGDSRGFASATEFLVASRRFSRMAHIETLVGHGTLRTAAIAQAPGISGQRLTEILCAMLDEALSEGAAGLSSGLMYAPGATAPREELEALCLVVARHGKLYGTHMRSYSWQLIESLDEQLDLARRTGCRLQISHLQAVGRANWHKQQLALNRIEAARATGIDVGFDAYPYLAGSTVLGQLVPQEAFEEGFGTFERLLSSPSQRANLEESLRSQTAQRWCDILIAAHAPLPNGENLEGVSIEQIARQRSVAPEAAVLDLLLETHGKINIIAFNQSESNLRALLTHPLCSVITDGVYVKGTPHPRLYGTFPFFLGSLCRDRGWLSLQEAIRKITSLPASRLGLLDRGRIAKGLVADLTVFDPEHITAAATYSDPCLPPMGIRLVLRKGLPLTQLSSPLDNR
jgi:dihydroorotase/N-acyl-D-amino-acid deacylase